MNRRLMLAGLMAIPAVALAHHGWSEYDSAKALKLTGKIVAYGYEHPHGHVRLETPGKTWLCVLAPPSRMENRGLSQDMLKPGTTATLEGYLPGSYHNGAANLSFVDGHLESHRWVVPGTSRRIMGKKIDTFPAVPATDFEWLKARTSVKKS